MTIAKRVKFDHRNHFCPPPCDGMLRYLPDPYTWDVEGEELRIWLCDGEYLISAEEI